MPTATAKSAFARGIRATSPFILVVFPFGLVYAVIASGGGLGPTEILAFSILVNAGTAQLAAFQLMQDGAPMVLVIVGGLIVVLRMAMYSAALVPWLGTAPGWTRALISYYLIDQTYAVSILQFEREPDMTVEERAGFFLGSIFVVVSSWLAGTVTGILTGSSIPDGVPIDAAVPISFLAITVPMLRTWAHRAAAVVAAVLGVSLMWMPSGTGMIVAALAAMVTGAQVEMWQERRK